MHPRMKRERKTIEEMISFFCRNHHGEAEASLCCDCRQLLEYALLRLKHCPFQEEKTSCGKCPRHCYKPDMRERVRHVMRFSGPRMILVHPFLAISHMVDGLQKVPKQKK